MTWLVQMYDMTHSNAQVAFGDKADDVEMQQQKALISTHTHAHAHTNTHTRTHLNTHVHTHACTHTHTHACARTHTHLHINTHAYTHTHTHILLHTHAHTYSHTHAHTHMHTRACSHTHTCVHTHIYKNDNAEIQQQHTPTQHAHKPIGLFCKRAFEKKDSFAKEPTKKRHFFRRRLNRSRADNFCHSKRERERERMNREERVGVCDFIRMCVLQRRSFWVGLILKCVFWI